MGKYIRKGKITGDFTVMEPSLGVRTRARAKTLALLKTSSSNSKSQPLPCSSSSSSSTKSSSCYLQLRSRRLQKCFPTKTTARASNPSNCPVSRPYGSRIKEEDAKSDIDGGIEVSLGENALDADGNGSRNSRETTPCSLIGGDSETTGTPGSTNRPTSTTASNRTIPSSTRRIIPTSREMEEFFSVPEQRQQRSFAEKYNFDPAKECPLPGRYEWVKLDN